MSDDMMHDILWNLDKALKTPKKTLREAFEGDDNDITQTIINDLKDDLGINEDEVEEGMDDKEIEKKPTGEVVITDKDRDTTTFKDAETAKEFLDQDDDKLPESFSLGDKVKIRESHKRYGGQMGRVTFIHEGNTYVTIGKSEIAFSPKELIKEAFGMYDDFEMEAEPVMAEPIAEPAMAPKEEEPMDYGVNPDLVKFDANNPQHRERLQRGTPVVLAAVLFHDPNADRTGVLSDLSKSGFFCKVIRNVDNQEVNAHMGDIEYADIYNNAIYEDFDTEVDKLLSEELTITKTDNPENPELNTVTITGTGEAADELQVLLQQAGLSSNVQQPVPVSQNMATVDQDMMLDDIDVELEELFANSPDELEMSTDAVTTSNSLNGLNGQKRHYRKEFPGDNPMASYKQMSEDEMRFKEILEAIEEDERQAIAQEAWDEETQTPKSERGKYKGKTLEELRSMLAAVKKSGPHKEGSPEYEKQNELEFAIRAKTGWGKVKESWDEKTETPKSERGKYKGKTKAELQSMLANVKKTGPHKKGSKEYERQNELEFALRAKSGWGKVSEDFGDSKKKLHVDGPFKNNFKKIWFGRVYVTDGDSVVDAYDVEGKTRREVLADMEETKSELMNTWKI